MILTGTHYEVGLQIGRQYRSEIISLIRQEFSRMKTKLNPHVLDAYLQATRQAYPQYLVELHGIAKGAHIEFESLFMFMCGEIWENYRAGCTDLMARGGATREGHTIIAHTNDQPLRDQKYVRVLRIKVHGEPELLLFTLAGLLISAAINSSGFCFTGNYLKANDEHIGVPRSIIYRALIASTTLPQAMRHCQHPVRASAENEVITTPDGRLIDLECSGQDLQIFEATGDLFAHSNHFTFPSMLKYEAYVEGLGESRQRLRRAYQLLQSFYGHITPDTMRDIMSDHGDGGTSKGICGHATQSATVFWLIYEPHTRRLRFGYGAPCGWGEPQVPPIAPLP